MNYFVYLIETKKGIYTGITNNLLKRFYQHQGIFPGGAKFFRGNPPLKLIYWEYAENRSGAQKREYQIKKMTRAQKVTLALQGTSQLPLSSHGTFE